MDKKYNIERDINSKSKSFKESLKDLLDREVWNLLLNISKQTDMYIFSGVIRDYFLNRMETARDIDLVLGNIKAIKTPSQEPRNLSYKKNSFGGYKIRVNSMNIDIWELKKTWGLIYSKKECTPENLTKTAFFNFSSIVYDFNNEKFIFDKSFVEFMSSKEIGVVFKENPNKPLCIVNTIYYSDKYGLKIKDNLRKWVMSNYQKDDDYDDAQRRHFGKVIINRERIDAFVLNNSR